MSWRRVMSLMICLGLVAGCDRLQTPEKKVDAGTPGPSTHPPKEPFEIEPGSWADVSDGRAFEVRELPDGRPGLFDADGGLLLRLMPELILDVTAAGKRRVKPQRKSFRLIRVKPREGGGFSVYGKFSDQNGKDYDLRVENGGGDPRVHVSISTRWARDVAIHRQIAVFRTGPVMKAKALHHDYEWRAVDREFVNSAHAPDIAEFGSGEEVFTAVGRTGVEGLTVRAVGEGRFDIEFEIHHYENHPLGVGDTCEQGELDGVAIAAEGSKVEMRADFVLGPSMPVLPTRYPDRKRAGVSLLDGDSGKVFASADDDGSPKLREATSTWVGDLSSLACEDGRFSTLASNGFEAVRTGSELSVEESNVFEPTEADPRRVVGYHHPQARATPDRPLNLFDVGQVETGRAAQWFSEQSIAGLTREWGATVVETDVAALLDKNASATKTVGESLTASESIWVAGIGQFAQRLAAISGVELEYLPKGIIRIRNAGVVDLPGLTLLLPPGVTARYPEGTRHESAGELTSFDLAAGAEQLVQLFQDGEPFWPVEPALVEVRYDNRPPADAPEQ